VEAFVLSDGDLVRAVQAGDASCLGLLLERHLADMRAVAVALLGYGPDAEDAVQDAMLAALRSLGELRDPDAVGAWLRTIVRNACRMQFRAVRPVVELQSDVAGGDSAEEVLDRHALRDWVWHAIGRLSEPLQTVVLLRHFGVERSYAEIAAICGVPVGTVRSRLNEARRQLAGVLLAEAAAAHDDAGALARRRGEGLEEMLRAPHGDLEGTIADLAYPDMVMAGRWGAVPSRDLLVHILRSDAADGVGYRVMEVTASRRFTVMECELISPPWDPTHCPPSALWLVGMREERIDGIRLYHPTPG
jgi:RNA polymerase sigma factor (sigma-70 family)